ncbi:MAG: hypothetical protein RLZ35_65 [Pseudomonadota bacterium]|jgi:hypothetical protein
MKSAKQEALLCRQHRAIQRAQSLKQRERRQALWRANRCEHARTQKADIQQILRRGYRGSAEPKLRERLKAIEDRERRYCQTTRHH